MATTYPRECARCGRSKPPWFKFCPGCFAIVQMELLAPNLCDGQDCNEAIRDDHYLCRVHWEQAREGIISECPECGEYKPAEFSLCRRCNAQASTQPSRATMRAASDTANTRRPYDEYDGADDAKAKDKRYWFNHQNNGVCNYCGHRYPYGQLQMEHMIPRNLGGPDNRRNMQLTCESCNQKKGTSTDLEFRQLNSRLIPAEERTPPRRPADPAALRDGSQGSRYQPPRSGPNRPQGPRPQPRRPRR